MYQRCAKTVCRMFINSFFDHRITIKYVRMLLI